MTNLVMYDSLYGNTQKVAETIARAINGKAFCVQDFDKKMLKTTKLLVVGCPIHGWRPSEPTLAFLSSLPDNSLKGISVAAFDTRIKSWFSGSASNKIDKILTRLGGSSISQPGKFIVTGSKGPLAVDELENAKAWAKEMLDKIDQGK